MPLKRPGHQPKIVDYFSNKHFKCQSETGTMSEVGGSHNPDNCGQSEHAKHDLSKALSDSSEMDVTESQKEACVGPAVESSVQQPEGKKSSADADQGMLEGGERPTEYRESSPTLELTDIFEENSEAVSNNSPAARTCHHISDVSSQEETYDLTELPKELSEGITKDQLKRLKSADLDLSHFQKHVDLSDSSVSLEKPDPTQHVKMPFYTFGLQGAQTRWDRIKSSLAKCVTVKSSNDFGKIIYAYNQSVSGKMDFSGFDNYLMNFDNKERTETVETLCKMAQLAVELEHVCSKPIPILQRQKDQAITLSQQQIACLLANAFFCTFPGHIDAKHRSSLPSINFLRLFSSGKMIRYGKLKDRSGAIVNKLRSLFHYFKRVTTCMPSGKVTFHRQILRDSDVPEWSKSRKQLTELHVASKGSIEDEEGLFQVDFANKYVGGGALGTGCVQEEIRFMITPELIVSRLFTEFLDSNECLIVTGCETFSTYSGYGDSFEWTGNYNDQTPRDEFGRKLTQVVMMDAIHLQKKREQFTEKLVSRELTKAYCGFFCPTRREGVELSAVSTGNWGCGAFGGDRHLKSLIQLMAAAEAGRDVCYFTFDDVHLVKNMHQVHTLLRDHSIPVGEIYQMIQRYRRHLDQEKKSMWDQPLFNYLLKHVHSGFLASSPERTDDDDSRDIPGEHVK